MKTFLAMLRQNWQSVAGNRDGLWLALLTRTTLLFGALALVKLALMFNLREHLYHSHWRLQGKGVEPFDVVNLCLFVALLVASFVRLSTLARETPVRTIRWVNAGFIAVGLIHWVFSRHTMDSSYLYPLIEGWHSLGDFASRIVLDVFFAPPFLIVYLAAYPVLYRVLAARKREAWSFIFLGAIAGYYFSIHQLDLVEFGPELSVINCFGIASLIALERNGSAVNWKWGVLPLSLLMAVWVLFSKYGELLTEPAPYFVSFVAFFFAVYLAAWLLAGKTRLAAPLSCLLPFYAVAFFFLANQHYPFAANYNFLIAWSWSLPSYLLWELLICSVSFALGLGLLALIGRKGLYVFDAIVLGLILLALADYRLTATMGVRMDWNVLIVVDSPKMIWRIIQPYLGQLIVGLTVLVTLYAVGLRFLSKHFSTQSATVFTRRPTFAYVVSSLGMIALLAPLFTRPDKARAGAATEIAATSPLVRGWSVKRYSGPEFVKISQDLEIKDFTTPTLPDKGSPRDLNVFLIVMESCYNKYLSIFGAPEETQAELKRHLDRMEVFPNFYSNFANSFHARFTVLSGFYATTEYASYLNPRIPAPSLFEILHERGYKNSLFDSCFTEYARFRDYVSHRNLEHLYDFNNMPGREKFKPVSWGLDETCTMEAIKAQFAEYARTGDRFCVAYFPVAPHWPFDSPSEHFSSDDLGEAVLHNNFAARYKNQLRFVDTIIARLIDSLADLKLLDNTLVIITNDHGEMVGDIGGLLGHGWNLEPYLTNTPLIIMDPARKGYRVNLTQGSQIDVLPTVLDLLNLDPPGRDLYQGVSLMDTNAARAARPIYLTSHRHRAIVQGNRYLLEDPSLRQASKPGEHMRGYTIRNEGAKTLYETSPDKHDITAQMDLFERMQKSLIVHYSHYREAVQGVRQSGAKPAAASTASP